MNLYTKKHFLILIILHLAIIQVGFSVPSKIFNFPASNGFEEKVIKLELDKRSLDEEFLGSYFAPYLPKIIFDQQDNLHIYYTAGLGYQRKDVESRKMWHKVIKDGVLIKDEILKRIREGFICSPAIDINENGEPLVLWGEANSLNPSYEDMKLNLRKYKRNGQTIDISILDEDAQLGLGNRYSLVASNKGIHIFWIDWREWHLNLLDPGEDHYSKIFYRCFKDGKLNNPIRLSKKGREVCWEVLARRDKEDIYVCWQQCGYNWLKKYWDIFNINLISTNWSNISRVSYDKNYNGTHSLQTSFDICFLNYPIIIWTNDLWKDKKTKTNKVRYSILKDEKWEEPRELGFKSNYLKIAGTHNRKIYILSQYFDDLSLLVLDENMREISNYLLSDSAYERAFDCTLNNSGEIAIVWLEIDGNEAGLQLFVSTKD